MEVEYILCQIQLGHTSLAKRTHRQEGFDPRLGFNTGLKKFAGKSPTLSKDNLNPLQETLDETV